MLLYSDLLPCEQGKKTYVRWGVSEIGGPGRGGEWQREVKYMVA